MSIIKSVIKYCIIIYIDTFLLHHNYIIVNNVNSHLLPKTKEV